MVQQTATTVDIDAKVVQVPTVADLDVQPQRVAGTQTWRWKFFNLDQLSIGQRKQNLIYDMVNEAKADVLVEPQVRFTKKLFGERTLTISGYPATYKNFRKPSEEDLKAIRAANGTPEKVVVVGDSAQYNYRHRRWRNRYSRAYTQSCWTSTKRFHGFHKKEKVEDPLLYSCSSKL